METTGLKAGMVERADHILHRLCSAAIVKRRSAEILIWWLMPWLMARLLVPAGFMPVSTAGEISWVLCSTAALGHAPAQDGPQPEGPDLHHGSLCPFAAAGALAPPPPSALVAARSFAAARLYASGTSNPTATDVAGDHWARGPPLIS